MLAKILNGGEAQGILVSCALFICGENQPEPLFCK